MSTNKYVPLIVPKLDIHTFETQLIDCLSCILVILGLIGNILGLFFFSSSRRTWKISSVYACLATWSSITNLLCVIRYAAILHSVTRHSLEKFIAQTWWACKFYELTYSFRIISSWITLFWMFERLICTSNGLKIFFNQWKTAKFDLIIPFLIVILIVISVIGPPVYMYEPKAISFNDTTGVPTDMAWCGLDINVSIRWKKYFQETHFGFNYSSIRCLFSELLPAGAIILFNLFIIYQIIRTCYRGHRSESYQSRKQRSRITSWMNGVLILHSLLFFVSLIAHIIGHILARRVHDTWWVLLAVLINCSLNFYIYCLSGKSFRNEIRRFIPRVKRLIFIRRQTRRQQQQQRTHRKQRLIH